LVYCSINKQKKKQIDQIGVLFEPVRKKYIPFNVFRKQNKYYRFNKP